MFCKKCGCQIADESVFCSNCGENLAPVIKKEDSTSGTAAEDNANKSNGTILSWLGFPVSLLFRLIFQQEFRVWNNILDGQYVYKLDTIPTVIICFVVFVFSAVVLYNGNKGKYINKQSVYLKLAIFTALALIAVFLPISRNFFDF